METAWLICRRESPRTYLTFSNGWSMEPEQARQFPDEAKAVAMLRGRPGKAVEWELDAQHCPVREVA